MRDADPLADDLLRLALAAERGRGRRCSATPAGRASASSASPTPTPSTASRSTATDGPLRHRRAQRRRRQLRRPQGRRRAAAGRRDHHRRQGHPHPRVPPPRRRAPTSPTAFRDTVASFEGSVAIGASAAADPDQLLLALRGSGQALYVGLADGCLRRGLRALRARRAHRRATCASTARRPANPENPNASRGQIVVLDGSRGRHARGHRAAGLRRHRRCRSPRPTLAAAQVTTRDIDRGAYPHFLLKEITEAPDQLPQDAARQARRARRRARTSRSGDEALPDDVRGRAARRAHRPGPGDRPGHRRTSPARAWPPRCSPHP